MHQQAGGPDHQPHRPPPLAPPVAPTGADFPRGAVPFLQLPALQLPVSASAPRDDFPGYGLDVASTFRSPPTTPRKYFRLAATLSAGAMVGSPNFTSCSTTSQPEYPFFTSVPKNAEKSMSPSPMIVKTLCSMASSNVHFLPRASSNTLW